VPLWPCAVRPVPPQTWRVLSQRADWRSPAGPKLHAMLESDKPLRLKPSTMRGKMERRVLHEAALQRHLLVLKRYDLAALAKAIDIHSEPQRCGARARLGSSWRGFRLPLFAAACSTPGQGGLAGRRAWLSAVGAECAGGSGGGVFVGGFRREREHSLILGRLGSCYVFCDLRRGSRMAKPPSSVIGPKRGRSAFAPLAATAKPKFRPPSMAGRKLKPPAGTKPKIQSKPLSSWKV
jgi:hypothetical protein